MDDMRGVVHRTPEARLGKRLFIDSLGLLLTASVVAGAWCWSTHRLSLWSWQIPLSWHDDTWYVLGLIKAFAAADIQPIVTKSVADLGAPGVANWNSFPLVEEPLYWGVGLLARTIGLIPAANLAVLLAHVLAGCSFYVAARAIGGRPSLATASAILFAASPYVFRRGLVHLQLAYCWHLPLTLLVLYWGVSRKADPPPRWQLWTAVVIGLFTGVMNQYYSFMFLQLTGLAMAVTTWRGDWRRCALLAGSGAAALFGFVAVNLDTLLWSISHGRNQMAIQRSLAGLEILAMKPLDLFLPAGHRIAELQQFLWHSYFSQVVVKSEIGSSYLGVAGGAALLFLVMSSLLAIVRSHRPSPGFWAIAWIFAFSIVGGLNALLGVAGIYFFRATNRYSIYILAISLLFAQCELSKRIKVRARPVLALVIISVGLWDQLPQPPDATKLASIADRVAADAALVAAAERELPDDSMIFQLPVMVYPEAPRQHEAESYEQLRPYLFSRSLRWSFGDHKGHGTESWAQSVAGLPPDRQFAVLRERGFRAVLVARRAYTDGGEATATGLRAAGARQIHLTPEFVLLKLPGGETP